MKGGGPRQSPYLYHVSEPIPENALSVSPLYLLTDAQSSLLSDVVNPWEFGTSNAAKTFQDECEADETVLYPVNIEGREDSLPVQMQTVHRFISDELDVSPHDCSWFYNLKGAVQCHTPLFVGLDEFKDIGKRVKEYDGLNPGIYHRKQQYALPGENKSPVQIGDDANDMRRAFQRDNPTFDSYEAILESMFGVIPEPDLVTAVSINP